MIRLRIIMKNIVSLLSSINSSINRLSKIPYLSGSLQEIVRNLQNTTSGLKGLNGNNKN